MLQAISVSKRYHKDYVLKNINLTLNSGDKVGIVGLHNSGKTVLMKLLAGDEKPSSGKILIDGNKLDKRKIAYIPQIPLFDPILKAKDIIRYVGDEEYLEKVNIDKEKKIKNMSLGEKKRLSLALSLSFSPEYLLIDDITMDEESKEFFLDFIRKFHGGVAVSYHNLKDVWEVIDKIIILSKGSISFIGKKDDIKFKIIKIRNSADVLRFFTKYYMKEGEYVEIWEEFSDNSVEEKLKALGINYDTIEASPDEIFLRFFA
ncbi:ATP-binding cassette domain-containing protein [Acidianus brierleyi]|uniref:ABC transporter ATP-binding protein n=1 Tax=Acidianus brierleyi TaxID=41673 RepID=A0A2U9IIC4_9CREN|nr:ABC transporter ATP-binding protein [Acidianus brierleyi]AWR95770.1 ATP-binding cassette domain-containing protein [Acidianus brierleyi]